MDRFGTVVYEGKEYKLTSYAEPTSRLLPSCYVNYHEAEEGEAYDFEMSATAEDEFCNKFVVTWILEGKKGEDDPSYEDMDFSYADDIEQID